MSILNVEIKARCEDPEPIRQTLREKGADFKGTDHQVDTYFNVPEGRLKLREGNIEQQLIYYYRPDSKTPKPSDVNLSPAEHPGELRNLLANALGIMVTVDKQREIYFIDNVKFHIDTVKGLGSFMEIEAIDREGTIGEERLLEQYNAYLELFGISQEDLLPSSYSDMLLDSD